MKKKKYPDGFPYEVPGNEENPTEAHCDNCNEVFDANEEGILAKAVGKNGEFHKYAFCSFDCACEFGEDNGEMIIDRLNDSSPFNISFRLNPNAKADDPVAEQSDETNPDDNQALSEAEELERLRKFNNRLQKQVKIVEKAESEWLKATGAVQSAKEEARALKEVFDAESKTLAVMVKNGVAGVGNELPGFSPEELEANDAEPVVVDLSQYSVSEIGISESVYDKLQDAKILTVEDLRVYLNQDPRNREKIPGIGTEKLNALTDKLNAFTEPLYKK